MPNTAVIDQSETELIALPLKVANMLRAEAKKSRLSVAEFLMQWLEDQADGREAAAILKRIESGKEKTIPAEEVWARLGI